MSSYSSWQQDTSHSRWYCHLQYPNNTGGQGYNFVLYYPDNPSFWGYYYFVKPQPGSIPWGRCVNPGNPDYDPNYMQWAYNNSGQYVNYPGGYCPPPPDGGPGTDITNIPDPPGSGLPPPPGTHFWTLPELKQSSWNSQYSTGGGNQVTARIHFAGMNGTYDTAFGQGQLTNIQYGIDTNTNPAQPFFQINGHWSMQGQSGQFIFSSNGRNSFNGSWQGNNGNGSWNGTLAP